LGRTAATWSWNLWISTLSPKTQVSIAPCTENKHKYIRNEKWLFWISDPIKKCKASEQYLSEGNQSQYGELLYKMHSYKQNKTKSVDVCLINKINEH
jgi:hypothetical protein